MAWHRIRCAAAPCVVVLAWLATACSPAWAGNGDDGVSSWTLIRHALAQYLYGIGWLVIAVVFCIGTYRVFDWIDPLDFRKELEKCNIAMGIVIGMLLLGLTLGTLIFAGMIS